MAGIKKKATPKPTPKGAAAIKALQTQTSKKGLTAMEKRAQAALDKKYGWR